MLALARAGGNTVDGQHKNELVALKQLLQGKHTA